MRKTLGKTLGKAVVEVLEKAYPDAGITLDFTTPFELLVATILAAQCTDERVNRVTRGLFAKYRSPDDYLRVPSEELEADIHPTGFYRNKTRSIRGMSSALVERFDGRVPDDLDSLTSLPGVGRKTANIVLGNAFGQQAIAVDTHVGRVSTRLGFAPPGDPDRIEAALRELVPRENWTLFTHLLVFHGRRCCRSKTPRCGECPLFKVCAWEEKEAFTAEGPRSR